ncbi:MAG: xylan 1,4-beta-xylosidase [Acidobacteriaceae bacterium]|nr:xylan 1,4-beta-xylosidase [Acidobacteriaceae bacterium]
MGGFSPIWSYFGADEPNYIYGPHGRKLLDELGELGRTADAPVYFRAHNLFTTGNGDGSLKWGSTNVYTERADGTPVYDWTITDRIFDAMWDATRDAHVRPIVELGFMPEALSTHPQPYRHNFPKGDVFTGWSYPPKDYAKWGALVEAYAAHLKDRYGTEVDGWLWEVWNEPDIGYWHGTPEEYDRLYDVSAAAVRTVLPRAKIGGPDSTGVYAAKNGAGKDGAGTNGVSKSDVFLRQFLTHCAQGKNAATGGTGAPLDFISFHPKGSPKFVDGHVVMNVGQQLAAVQRGMEVVASYPEWRNTPIVLGESDPEGCAACQGAQNGYRNGPLYGVSVAETTARTWELARKHGVRVQGAVTWAFTFENQPYFAGFRELATNGVDKAVLNVFRMMAMLGGDWVRTESTGALPVEQIVTSSVTDWPDVDAIATRRGREVDVLLWNYHDADLPAIAAKVAMEVRGLPVAQVTKEIFLMDATHSNAYAVWQRMGSPKQPSAAQQKELIGTGRLQREVAPHALAVKGGAVTLQMLLERQGVALVRLRW